MQEDSNCVVLFSGGMDSTVVLHHALQQHQYVHAISFNYGQRHTRELVIAQDYILNLNTQFGVARIKSSIFDIASVGKYLTSSSITSTDIDVPKMKDVIGDPQNSTYVPNRNMMFLSIAAACAESAQASKVYYGAALADDTSGFWDCCQPFRDQLNALLSLNRRNCIEIQAPLINMSKREIIEYGHALGVDFSCTHTCYKGLDIACGECPSCSARLRGWIDAGYIDPIVYNRNIDWEKFNCKKLK